MRAALLALLAAAAAACASPGPAQPSPAVDAARYMGRWYEIARYPHWFERGCVAVTADYALNPDGSVAVLNTCRVGSPDGPVRTARGTAWRTDATGSRYKVSFFRPFTGPYWIVALDPDYRWALVGHPRRSSLWILSRTPRLPPQTEAAILKTAAGLGYDTRRLVRDRPLARSSLLSR